MTVRNPDLPIVVGLDGGYVHSSQQRSRTDGWFEVIAGKAIPAEGRPACFGYVQTYDTKPKRRLFEVPKSQGMAANQQDSPRRRLLLQARTHSSTTSSPTTFTAGTPASAGTGPMPLAA